MSAALAYYTIFSIAPLLIICIAISGMVFEPAHIELQIVSQIGMMFGPASAKQIQNMLTVANYYPTTGIVTQIIGIAVLFFGASGVFEELHSGLNIIWKVKLSKQKGWLYLIKNRFLSFTMVLCVGFLLLVSLILTLVLTSASSYLNHLVSGGAVIGLILHFIVSLGGITLLFALIFKILPEVDLCYKDVWLGAFVTTLLFILGKFLLSIYLGSQHIETSFGTAGSLVVLLIWIYYSAQILFIGAEFTKAYVQAKEKAGNQSC